MSGSNIFDKAIERIQRDGWHQGGFKNARGERCILGALACELRADGEDLVNGHGEVHPSVTVIQNEVQGSVAGFNDDPATSLEDVFLVLKKASAAWDEAQGA